MDVQIYVSNYGEQRTHLLGELISSALCQQICNVGTSVSFYMNSYLVYIAAAMGSFSGLSTKEDHLQVPVWNYYDQITLANSKFHYKRVQDALFGHYRSLFDRQLSIKRVFDAAWEKVNQYDCIFLQFLTFTYLRVGYFKGESYTLPTYTIDQIILIELARQLMDVQSDQHALHRPRFGITSAKPLSIGNYSIVFVPKVKNMEAELQLITLKKFKARFDFDYRGMNSQIKRAYTHVHRIEDIWIDMRTELDIMKMDYCRLTLQQIIDLNMLEIPPDFQVEDDGNIFDTEFHQANFDKMCPFPIQWQQKEGTSIMNRFQSILANTNKWLKSKALKRVNPKTGLDCGSFGPPGRKSQLKITGKDGASSSNAKSALKFKLKGGKGTKSSQVPKPIQESAVESEEELETESKKEDSDEEE